MPPASREQSRMGWLVGALEHFRGKDRPLVVAADPRCQPVEISTDRPRRHPGRWRCRWPWRSRFVLSSQRGLFPLGMRIELSVDSRLGCPRAGQMPALTIGMLSDPHSLE